MQHRNLCLILGACSMIANLWSADAPTPELKVAGDWQVEVTVPASKDGATKELKATLTVAPPAVTTVTDEKYASLPVYTATAPGWTRGERLIGLRAFECTAKSALDPASVLVRSAAADAIVFERGKDYEMDQDWGTLGRLPAGRIGAETPVVISYRYVKLRLDSVVVTKSGELELRQGEPHIATPAPPTPNEGDVRIANLFLLGRRQTKLTPDCFFPLLESAYPEPPKATPSLAEQRRPSPSSSFPQR